MARTDERNEERGVVIGHLAPPVLPNRLRHHLLHGRRLLDRHLLLHHLRARQRARRLTSHQCCAPRRVKGLLCSARGIINSLINPACPHPQAAVTKISLLTPSSKHARQS